MNSLEWEQGYDAYMAHTPLSENPYRNYTGIGDDTYHRYSEWAAGWSAAKRAKTWD